MNKKVAYLVYDIMLFSMLHSSFIAPIQEIYFDNSSYKTLEYGASRIPLTEKKVPVQNFCSPAIACSYASTPGHAAPISTATLDKHSKPFSYYALLSDLAEGRIGVSKEFPLDDPSDNLFKINITTLPTAEDKVLLSYELYGISDQNGVSKSINDRPALGGYLIKKQNSWSQQTEEIDAASLKEGINKIMFTTPKGSDHTYKIKNLKVEVVKKDHSEIASKLVLNTKNIFLQKDNSIYIKGFVKNTATNNLKIVVEGTELHQYGSEFEGFVSLKKEDIARNFVVARAYDGIHLVGQEIITLGLSYEADNIYPIEKESVSKTFDVKAFSASTHAVEGASIQLADSSMTVSKPISITALRKIDIAPMSSGMVNVTKGGKAFRFLPDGTKFNAPVKITLDYDAKLLPAGYGPKDIKTFYFDTDAKQWRSVKVDSIDTKNHKVTAITNHFTDYINGIIQAPESPETSGFTPTMMSDIKISDASSEVTLISPPEVSQKGSANISYPIKIPAGTKGMQPQLSVQYSNEGGNGWLGQGWSINIPAITIDTRWGIPLLDTTNETEMYSLNGEALMYPKIAVSGGSFTDWMPNRHYDSIPNSTRYSTVARPRIANAVFTMRKEGTFMKIQRMGTSPSNYYWKVTNTDGTINWYGGKNGVDEHAVIKRDGKIVHWALFQTEDVFGNNIKYEYDDTVLNGLTDINANLNGGKIFNIKRIVYTGYNETPGKYEILFNRTTSIRNDVNITARLGVKQVEPYFLSNILVRNVSDSPTNFIRKYGFDITYGRFQKGRLIAIKEYGKNNTEFYRHEFEYYDALEDPKDHFSAPVTINVPSFNPDFNLLMNTALGSVSRINSSEATEYAWGARPAAGLQFNWVNSDPSRLLTFGFPIGESYTKSKGKITLVDMNGDGLDDVLFKSGNTLKYFPHMINSTDNSHYFDSNPKEIININNFSKTDGKTKTMAIESMDFRMRKLYLGKKRFKTNEETSIYITDANGDMLPDIVNNKTVYFNTGLASNGTNTFTTSSKLTPNMVITAKALQIEPEDEVDENDRDIDYDVVRVWEAPYDGKITITDNIEFLPQSSDSKIIYSIETTDPTVNNNQPFRLYLKEFNSSYPSENISIDAYSTYNTPLGVTGVNQFVVVQGQKIYFRVHKNNNGSNDVLKTNPTILYNSNIGQNLPDQNGNTIGHYNYHDDFVLSNGTETVIPSTGSIAITWDDFYVDFLSDDITYKIIKVNVDQNDVVTQTVLYQKQVLMNTSELVYAPSNLQNYVISNLSPDDYTSIRFEVTSKSNVRWQSAQWKPKLVYTPDNNAIAEGITDATTSYPVPTYTIFEEFGLNDYHLTSGGTPSSSTSNYWPLPSTFTTYSAMPNTNIHPSCPTPLGTTDNGVFSFVMKKDGITLGRRIVTINAGVITLDNDDPIPFYSGIASLSNQPKVTFEFYVEGKQNLRVFKKYTNAVSYHPTYTSGIGNVIIGHQNEWDMQFGFDNYNHYWRFKADANNNNKRYLGNMYRGWGQFLYNDVFDISSLPSDSYSKLINNNIIDLFEDNGDLLLHVIGGINIEDCASSNAQNVSSCLEGQFNNSLNLPSENTTIDDSNIDGLIDGTFDNISTSDLQKMLCLLTTFPYRFLSETEQIEKWIGQHTAQYSSNSESRNGNFTDSELGSVFDEPTEIDSPELIADENTGMIALNKTQKSVAIGKSAGRGRLVLSKSESRYSDSASDFMDMNGDRYPDVMTSKKIQKTTMTGGHLDPDSDYGYSPLGGAASKVSSLGYSGSYTVAGRKDIENEKSDNGNPSYSLGVAVTIPLSGNNRGKETLADLNGDGLPDRIIIANNEYKYKLNLGNAFTTITSDTYQNYEPYKTQPKRGLNPSYSLSGAFMNEGRFPFSVSAGYSTSESDTQTLLLDMNGDGLPDLVNFTGSSSGTVRYNLGNSFSSQLITLSHPDTNEFSLYKNIKSSSISLSGSMNYFYGFPIFTTLFFTLFAKVGGGPEGNANLTISETKKEFRDFNGDGYADMIEKNGNNLKVYYSKIGKTDMLKSVKNPLGGSFIVDYQVKPVNYNNPTAKWVMSELTIHDGYDKMNDGEDTYKKTFAYENGVYDRREREFYGYETVKVSDPTVLRTTVSKYHNQNYFLNGLLKESYVIKGNDENKKYSRTENTYEIKKLNDSNTGIIVSSNLPDTFDTGGTEGRRSAVVVLTKTNNYFYELSASPQLTTEISYTYDSLGRIVTYDNKGNINDVSDNYTSAITYHDAPTLVSKNIISIPKTIEVSTQAGTMRKRSTIVDENTGNITELKAYLNNSTSYSTFMTYDAYGNMTQITYPPNSNNESAFYQYTYESEYHKYVIKITDAFGNYTETKYDSDFDKITETTDIAGNKTQYQYDNYGRNILVRGTKEMQANVPYTITTDYYLKHSALPANSGVDATTFVPVSVTKHYDIFHPTNDIETYTFIDGMARPIQVKKDISIDTNNSQQDPNFSEALSVSGKTHYDEYGRATKQYHPYYELKNANSVFLLNEHNSPYHASTYYDELDRPITSIDAAGNESFTEYSIDQDNFGTIAQKTKSTTDQNGSQSIITESYKDVFGRVISSMNAEAGGNIWTRFSYNAIGELLSYTDAENLSTIYKYDNLGRKISISHPDNGLTTYYYDKAGNLEKLQTANLEADSSLNPSDQFIKYNYDYNRLIGINYPDIQGQPNISNVTYTYGTSGNGKGRIIEQLDATGSQNFQYGNMGEIKHITRTVVGPNIPTRSFETDFLYDSWNRIIEMIYPDGEKIYYDYDLGGNLNKITGEVNGAPYDYIKRIHYDHYEQKTYQLYGNDAETSFSYSPELRRLDLLTARTSSGESLFENAYSYDKVGNVLSILNSSTPTSNQIGGSYFHNFGYDQLNRLIAADGNFTGDGQIGNGNDFHSDYNLSMNYNTTHGITNKTQSHLKNLSTSDSYDNNYTYIEGTHKVEKIINSYNNHYENFTYDLNGNITIRDEYKKLTKKYLWDESNRLRVAFDENNMQHYIYDANGDRVLKANTHSETVYENGMLTYPTSVTINGYTTYPSAYLVVDPQGVYSKHYFAGSQRIASQIGTESTDIFLPRAMATDPKKGSDEKLQQIQIADLQKLAALSGHKVSFAKNKPKEQEPAEDSLEEKDQKQQRLSSTALLYFYHPDHLGTSTFLTDYNGNAYQFFLNLPFGETMAEQKSITEDYETPYKFNGKELDEETGLYYYGARYYDPKTSIWLSVDPLMEKYPNFNPYAYCYQNPINIIDPTGMEGKKAEPPINGLDYFRDDTGEYFWNHEKNTYEHYADPNNNGANSFQGYYNADEFSKPVGDYAIIFDLSNAKLKDEFNVKNTITSVATPLMASLKYKTMMRGGEIKDISDPNKYPGVKIYSATHMNGAVTLGNVIFTNPRMEDSETLIHEYGHYLDFKFHFNFDKNAYLKTIGLPSILSATRATFSDSYNHHSSESEMRADILGGAYFNHNLYKK